MKEVLEIFRKFRYVEKEEEGIFIKSSERVVDGVIYGKPLYFMSYNKKKPYLQAKTRREPEYICNYEEACVRKQFYDWLWKFRKNESIFIYYNGDYSTGYRAADAPCIFMSVDKNKRGILEITDYEILP